MLTVKLVVVEDNIPIDITLEISDSLCVSSASIEGVDPFGLIKTEVADKLESYLDGLAIQYTKSGSTITPQIPNIHFH